MCFCLGACVCTRGMCVCIGGMCVYLGVCLHVWGHMHVQGMCMQEAGVCVEGACICARGMGVFCVGGMCVYKGQVYMHIYVCVGACVHVQGAHGCRACVCRGHVCSGHVCMCVCREHVCITVSMQRTEKAQSLTFTLSEIQSCVHSFIQQASWLEHPGIVPSPPAILEAHGLSMCCRADFSWALGIQVQVLTLMYQVLFTYRAMLFALKFSFNEVWLMQRNTQTGIHIDNLRQMHKPMKQLFSQHRKHSCHLPKFRCATLQQILPHPRHGGFHHQRLANLFMNFI